MIRILIILVLVIALYYMVRGLFRPKAARNSKTLHPGARREEGNELVKDPYCQTYIPTSAAIKARMGGENLFFCSEECMNRYAEEKRGRASRVG